MAAVCALALVVGCGTNGGGGAASGAASGAATGDPQNGIRYTFDDSPSGTLPASWQPAETAPAGTPAAWSVQAVPDAVSGSQVLRVRTDNRSQTYNLLLAEGVHGPDLTLGVALRARGGSEDQGGGLLWRAQGPNDYYIARWNPLEQNLRLYEVVGGRRRMLATADVQAAPDAWHRLVVRARGEAITVALDWRELLQHTGTTFPGAGKVGLWTKADATVDFDDLVIDAQRAPGR